MKRSAPISFFGMREARNVDSVKWKERRTSSLSPVSRVASSVGIETGTVEEDGMAPTISLFCPQAPPVPAPLLLFCWKLRRDGGERKDRGECSERGILGSALHVAFNAARCIALVWEKFFLGYFFFLVSCVVEPKLEH